MKQTLPRAGFLALSAILLAWAIQAGPGNPPIRPGTGCGFRYAWAGPDGRREQPGIHGFGFHATDASQWDVWGDADPYSLLSVYGTDGSDVEDYREFKASPADGRLEQFRAIRRLESLPLGPEPANILRLYFTYREDGSLCRKDYFHNGLMFGTTYSSSTLFYDGAERLPFAKCYITHGSLEYYCIYLDDGSRPAYCLVLDDNIAGYVPEFVRY